MGTPVTQALGDFQDSLVASGFDSIDYAELRNGGSLAPLHAASPNARLFVAARIGGTRLIDNLAIS